MNSSWLLSTWVKSSKLKEKNLIILSACLSNVNPELYRRITEGKEVLQVCPEREGIHYRGKLALIIKSCKPKLIEIVTLDGSPHCYLIHASINTVEYILGYRLNKKHYVVVNGEEIREISSEAVRLARYLHIIDELLRKDTKLTSKLENLSLEMLEQKKYKEE